MSEGSTERTITYDRMRFTKNTTSSRLALLAIVFDVLYFISIYKSDVDKYYYTILIGGSIILNLVFLLATFLASEGVKNYKPGYSWLMMALGVLQVVRIFILPMDAHNTLSAAGTPVMDTFQFIRCIIYLLASGVCLFAAAGVNLHKSGIMDAQTALANAA